MRFIFGKVHYLVSKLNKINATYNYETSQSYENIKSDISTSYLYRLGLQESPVNRGNFSADTSLITNNSLVSSSNAPTLIDLKRRNKLGK